MESTIALTGYVGHDIELRSTRSGVPTVSFRVGTTPRVRTESGWNDGTTTWTTVVCYRALADHVAHSVGRGDPVIVHGRVRTQVWTDAGGEHHEKTVVEAVAVGHDLTRGVSAFARVPVRTAGDGPAAPVGTAGEAVTEAVEAGEAGEADLEEAALDELDAESLEAAGEDEAVEARIS